MNKETPSQITAQREGKLTGEETESDSPSGAVNSDRCQRCTVSRWYPPMMLASTALTVVFFWMYINKPVFSPVPSITPLRPEPAIQSKEPARAPEIESYITSRNTLDPAALRLPTETKSQSEISDRERVSGDELRPLIIKRNGPSLFRRFPAGAAPEQVTEEEAPSNRESETGSNERGERTDVGRLEGVNSDSDLGTTGDPDSRDLHVHASVMGEFLVSKGLEETNHAME